MFQLMCKKIIIEKKNNPTKHIVIFQNKMKGPLSLLLCLICLTFLNNIAECKIFKRQTGF